MLWNDCCAYWIVCLKANVAVIWFTSHITRGATTKFCQGVMDSGVSNPLTPKVWFILGFRSHYFEYKIFGKYSTKILKNTISGRCLLQNFELGDVSPIPMAAMPMHITAISGALFLFVACVCMLITWLMGYDILSKQSNLVINLPLAGGGHITPPPCELSQ